MDNKCYIKSYKYSLYNYHNRLITTYVEHVIKTLNLKRFIVSLEDVLQQPNYYIKNKCLIRIRITDEKLGKCYNDILRNTNKKVQHLNISRMEIIK